MPGMMPPPEVTPLERAIEKADFGKALAPVRSKVFTTFCQSVPELVLGKSRVSPYSGLLTEIIKEIQIATSCGDLVAATGNLQGVSIGSIFPRKFARFTLGEIPPHVPGLAGFPSEELKHFRGRWFAGEKKDALIWLLEYDYQPNHLGLLLALCLAFPANHRFYLSSLPHLFPRFDEEALLNILLGDGFQNIKVNASKKGILESLKSGVFPRAKAFIPGPVWEDLVGEHLSSWNSADYHQDWCYAASVEKINRAFCELDADNWEKYDAGFEIEKYRGWKIAILTPNGGITDVSVFDGAKLFSLPTEAASFPVEGDGDRFGDDDGSKVFTDRLWHIALAKNFIDWKGGETVQRG
jgi:hypothetical protein